MGSLWSVSLDFLVLFDQAKRTKKAAGKLPNGFIHYEKKY